MCFVLLLFSELNVQRQEYMHMNKQCMIFLISNSQSAVKMLNYFNIYVPLKTKKKFFLKTDQNLNVNRAYIDMFVHSVIHNSQLIHNKKKRVI